MLGGGRRNSVLRSTLRNVTTGIFLDTRGMGFEPCLPGLAARVTERLYPGALRRGGTVILTPPLYISTVNIYTKYTGGCQGDTVITRCHWMP